jgi:hypothetical protein
MPLSMNLWRATVVTMVLITVILNVLWRALSKHEADAYDLLSSAFRVFAVLCQIGEEIFYRSILFFVH